MQEQREVQAWFGGGGGGRTGHGPAGIAERNAMREGAPFQAPPPLVGAVGGQGKAPVFSAAAGGPESQQSKPPVVLRDVRPKRSRNSGGGKGKGRSKAQMS